jgi:D-amino peptidase
MQHADRRSASQDELQRSIVEVVRFASDVTDMTDVFVSVDLEGCADVVHWDEVRPSASAEYQHARALMTSEVNAVVEGAFAGGASCVVVNDSHSVMRNIEIDVVDPRATVISGRLKPQFMLEGLRPGFGAALFVGYHGAIGDAEAVMGHTYSPRVIFECRLNGEPVGETTINAALAGHYGVPVALISGDRTTLLEAKRNIPWALGIETKVSIGYFAADCLSPSAVCTALRAGAADAVARAGQMRPFVLAAPMTMEIDTQTTSQADALELIGGMGRLGARTVSYAANDFPSIYRALTAVIHLGSAA